MDPLYFLSSVSLSLALFAGRFLHLNFQLSTSTVMFLISRSLFFIPQMFLFYSILSFLVFSGFIFPLIRISFFIFGVLKYQTVSRCRSFFFFPLDWSIFLL